MRIFKSCFFVLFVFFILSFISIWVLNWVTIWVLNWVTKIVSPLLPVLGVLFLFLVLLGLLCFFTQSFFSSRAEKAYLETDYRKAIKWYEKAAAWGDIDAVLALGDMSVYGYHPIIEMRNERWWHDYAPLRPYIFPEAVLKDSEQAIKWYEKAAELGNTKAMCRLGNVYADGEIVQRDSEQAIKWYEKAAELKSTDAMCRLGNMYADGEIVSKDYKQAKYWIKKAYDAGNEDAKKVWNTLELWKY
jgi:TPR repeat protein